MNEIKREEAGIPFNKRHIPNGVTFLLYGQWEIPGTNFSDAL